MEPGSNGARALGRSELAGDVERANGRDRRSQRRSEDGGRTWRLPGHGSAVARSLVTTHGTLNTEFTEISLILCGHCSLCVNEFVNSVPREPHVLSARRCRTDTAATAPGSLRP